MECPANAPLLRNYISQAQKIHRQKKKEIVLWSLMGWGLIYGKALMLRIMFIMRESHGISQ
jgi:hypothetical protein